MDEETLAEELREQTTVNIENNAVPVDEYDQAMKVFRHYDQTKIETKKTDDISLEEVEKEKKKLIEEHAIKNTRVIKNGLAKEYKINQTMINRCLDACYTLFSSCGYRHTTLIDIQELSSELFMEYNRIAATRMVMQTAGRPMSMNAYVWNDDAINMGLQFIKEKRPVDHHQGLFQTAIKVYSHLYSCEVENVEQMMLAAMLGILFKHAPFEHDPKLPIKSQKIITRYINLAASKKLPLGSKEIECLRFAEKHYNRIVEWNH